MVFSQEMISGIRRVFRIYPWLIQDGKKNMYRPFMTIYLWKMLIFDEKNSEKLPEGSREKQNLHFLSGKATTNPNQRSSAVPCSAPSWNPNPSAEHLNNRPYPAVAAGRPTASNVFQAWKPATKPRCLGKKMWFFKPWKSQKLVVFIASSISWGNSETPYDQPWDVCHQVFFVKYQSHFNCLG